MKKYNVGKSVNTVEQQNYNIKGACKEMNIKKNNIIMMSAVVLSASLLLSSCGAGAAESSTNNLPLEHNEANVQAATYGAQSKENNISDNAVINSADSANTSSESTSRKTENANSETVLPPNMTMDDLLNMVQINGKTLTMPTTLNTIMALDEGFSYNLYSDLEESKKQNLPLRYHILYNDVYITDVYMLFDDYNANDVGNSRIPSFANEINSRRCDEAGISFQIGDIDFNSTKDDVINFLGTGKSEKGIKGEHIEYSYHDKFYGIKIQFFFPNEKDTVSAVTYSLSIRKGEE